MYLFKMLMNDTSKYMSTKNIVHNCEWHSTVDHCVAKVRALKWAGCKQA